MGNIIMPNTHSKPLQELPSCLDIKCSAAQIRHMLGDHSQYSTKILQEKQLHAHDIFYA